MADRLGQVLKNIHIPDAVLTQLEKSLLKLLKVVLSNCAIDAASVYPTYKKPFDMIFARAKNEEWRARRDSNSRPSGFRRRRTLPS